MRVLESFPAPRPTTNPYLIQLVRSLPPEVHVRSFGWRRALLGSYDVFHVHWPENLQRGATAPRTLLRRVLTAALLLRLAVLRTPVVRTLHNIAPHEPGDRVERFLLRRLDRLTAVWIRLNPRTEPPTSAPVRTIPHGHYRDWFADAPRARAQPGLLCMFGLLRPYKGVEDLLDALAAVPQGGVSLRIVGRAPDDGLRRRVEGAAATDPRVSARLEYVSDAELALEVTRAAAVVLPYRQLHNSGAALLALSLGRPVLLPEGPTATELAQEVGHEWVRTFSPPLTAEGLATALDRLDAPDGPGPDLTARGWAEAGTAHAAVFRTAMTARRGGGGR